MNENKASQTPSEYQVTIDTDLLKRSGLKPWQLKYLAVNIASELNPPFYFSAEDDRSNKDYLFSKKQTEISRLMAHVKEALRFHRDDTPESLGYSPNYLENSSLSISVPTDYVHGAMVFLGSTVSPEAVQITPAVVRLVLEKYIELEAQFSVLSAQISDTTDMFNAQDSFKRTIYRELYQSILEIKAHN